MSNVVNFLYTYLDDPAEVMSKARVNETIAEIERLQAELAASKAEIQKLKDDLVYQQTAEYVALEDRDFARKERDAMRELLREAAGWMWLHGPDTLRIRIDAALNKGDGGE